MATLDEIEARKAASQEMWELTVPGRVFVEVTNHLGRPKTLTVVGRGSRLRISTFDRELAEERIRSDANNPFRNGMLVRTDSGASEPESPEAIGDGDLKALFGYSDDEFKALLGDMGEVNVRRLKDLAADPEVGATVSQQAIISDTLAERFPIGGTVPSYDELMRNPIRS